MFITGLILICVGDKMADEENRYPALVTECLNALGAVFGGTVMVNDDDCINIEIEDENPVTIHINLEDEKFEIIATVADELPDPVSYSLVLNLLDLALCPFVNGGPAVGRDPETGYLEAYVIIPFKGLTPDDFVNALKEFLKFQIAISQEIESSNEGDGSDDTFISRAPTMLEI